MRNFLPAAILLLAGTAALAQPLKPQVSESGDWAVRCFPVQGPAPCDLYQQDVDTKHKRRLTSVSIAYAPAKGLYAAQVVVPLGVELSQNLTVSGTGFALKPLPFRRCERDGCYVETTLPAEAVEEMAKAGPKAELTVVSIDGRSFRFPMSMRGFAEGLAQLKSDAAKTVKAAPSQK